MCVLVCVHSSKCGLVQGSGEGRGGSGDVCYSACTVHGVNRSKLTHNPLLPPPLAHPPSPLPALPHPDPADRKSSFIWTWIVGGANSARWELLRVIIPPLLLLIMVLDPSSLSPPLFFCPAWSLCLHGKSAFNSSIVLSRDPFPGGHRARSKSRVTRFGLTIVFFSSSSVFFFLTPSTQTHIAQNKKGENQVSTCGSRNKRGM